MPEKNENDDAILVKTCGQCGKQSIVDNYADPCPKCKKLTNINAISPGDRFIDWDRDMGMTIIFCNDVIALGEYKVLSEYSGDGKEHRQYHLYSKDTNLLEMINNFIEKDHVHW